MTINEIATQIINSSSSHRPVIIGVEGYGGSGKSTFAEGLIQALDNAYIIKLDDFIIKEQDSDANKSDFDRFRLENQVLAPAKNGNEIKYQQLIWSENKLSPPIKVPEVNYLIIEGISSYHPYISHFYDFKIWVEAPMNIAKQRGIKRDKELDINNDELWEVWAKTDLEYQELYHPEQEADFIFDNSQEKS